MCGFLTKLELQARSVTLEAQIGNTLAALYIVKDLGIDVHHTCKF